MLSSSLCDHSNVFTPVTETITIIGAGADDAAKQEDQINKEVIF